MRHVLLTQNILGFDWRLVFFPLAQTEWLGKVFSNGKTVALTYSEKKRRSGFQHCA